MLSRVHREVSEAPFLSRLGECHGGLNAPLDKVFNASEPHGELTGNRSSCVMSAQRRANRSDTTTCSTFDCNQRSGLRRPSARKGTHTMQKGVLGAVNGYCVIGKGVRDAVSATR